MSAIIRRRASHNKFDRSNAAKARISSACRFEPLESRQLLSAVINIQTSTGATSATATSVGQIIPLQIWATITGKNASGADDGVQSITGSFLSSLTQTGGVKGDLTAATDENFQANGSQFGTQTDLNGDGNLDVGSNDGSTIAGFFNARDGQMDTTGTVSGASQKFLIGTLNYKVTSLGSGKETDITYRPRTVIGLGFSGVWQEDGVVQDETTSTLSAGPAFKIDPGSVQQSVQLTGAVIGTSGSYKNQGNTIAKAFDGNLSTFYDGATANGNWAGLDLGAAGTVTSISYAPRTSWAARMVGGIFQGSNSATFASGNVNLFTITTTPPQGVLTTVNVSASGTFRYVRYLSPTGSYGNIAEAKFFGIPGVVVTHTKLTGTVIGTSGSYKNQGNTIAKAVDGNLSTFYDGATANGNWVGLDTGSGHTITQIKFAPRSGWAARMVGGIFQASNSANFSTGVVNLYTVPSAPVVGSLTTINITAAGPFRYFRYLSPTGSYGNVAEVQFFT